MTQFTAPPRSTKFRASIKRIAPPWLQGPSGFRVLYSLGFQIDYLAEWLRHGVIARMPHHTPTDGLPAIGSDRKMLRGFREGDAGYADRLSGAFPTWRLAGNARTVLAQMAAYFAPDPPKMRIVTPGLAADGTTTFAAWWTLDGGVFSYHEQSPTNWDWDTPADISLTERGRFWLIIYRNEGFTPWYWGDGHYWGGGQSWGYEESFTENFAADARRFVQHWKAAGSHAWRSGGIIVTSDQALWDPAGTGATYPNGTWSQPSNRYVGPFYLDGV